MSLSACVHRLINQANTVTWHVDLYTMALCCWNRISSHFKAPWPCIYWNYSPLYVNMKFIIFTQLAVQDVAPVPNTIRSEANPMKKKDLSSKCLTLFWMRPMIWIQYRILQRSSAGHQSSMWRIHSASIANQHGSYFWGANLWQAKRMPTRVLGLCSLHWGPCRCKADDV
jgi:hypothetical protein